MNFVHKQDIVFRKVGQQRGQVSRFFNGRAGGNADIDPHLIGNNIAQGGLAQSRRAVEQNVVQRFIAHLGCLDKHLQIPFRLLLADIFI